MQAFGCEIRKVSTIMRNSWATDTELGIEAARIYDSRSVRRFSDRPGNCYEMFRASVQKHPTAEAVVDGQVRLSYEQLDERVRAAGAGLGATGIAPGDRIVSFMGNRWEFFVFCLAANRIGAIAVPVGPLVSPAGLEKILRHSGAKALVFDGDLQDRLPDLSRIPELVSLFHIGNEIRGSISFSDMLKNPVPSNNSSPAVNEEDIAFLMYTSGSTGEPKGVEITALGLFTCAEHYRTSFDITHEDRTLLAIPGMHISGLAAVIYTFFHASGTIVIMGNFDRRLLVPVLAAERITYTVFVPTIYTLCLNQPELADYDLTLWRLGTFGGGPMPIATIEGLAEKLPRLALSNGYGATESTTVATLLPPGLTSEHSDSIGFAVPCAEIKIVDKRGNECAPRQHGEIWIGGPGIARGYWNDPEKTRKAFVNGYWRSGDIGSKDENGLVYLHDRIKDIIIRGGYNIYSAELENEVSFRDDVAECAVIGVPDSVLGERIFMYICIVSDIADTPTEADIIEFCRDRVSEYKLPDRVVIQKEQLPRNMNGKLDKLELRKIALTSSR